MQIFRFHHSVSPVEKDEQKHYVVPETVCSSKVKAFSAWKWHGFLLSGAMVLSTLRIQIGRSLIEELHLREGVGIENVTIHDKEN